MNKIFLRKVFLCLLLPQAISLFAMKKVVEGISDETDDFCISLKVLSGRKKAIMEVPKCDQEYWEISKINDNKIEFCSFDSEQKRYNKFSGIVEEKKDGFISMNYNCLSEEGVIQKCKKKYEPKIFTNEDLLTKQSFLRVLNLKLSDIKDIEIESDSLKSIENDLLEDCRGAFLPFESVDVSDGEVLGYKRYRKKKDPGVCFPFEFINEAKVSSKELMSELKKNRLFLFAYFNLLANSPVIIFNGENVDSLSSNNSIKGNILMKHSVSYDFSLCFAYGINPYAIEMKCPFLEPAETLDLGAVKTSEIMETKIGVSISYEE